MAHLMRAAAPLKVEIRLQQALDGFIKDLAEDQKTEFLEDQETYRKSLPHSNDVISFMGQLNAKASRSNFGPRAQSILQVTQQFAAIGDVLIGGSQNLIACGVWTVVRFTLQAAVSSRKVIDKISEIFMKAGRSTPRYDALATLYDRSSTKLRTYYYEYFLTLVDMCHYLFKFLDKGVVSRAVSSLSDTELNSFESQLSEWATQIKDETIFLMAQGIEEQRSLLQSFGSLSKADEARRLVKARMRILNACSTYPYEISWKRLRKKGYTKLFKQISAYEEWKSSVADEAKSSTLVLTGSLGSGKSVLAANVIEDLGSAARIGKVPLLYFFCEYENSQSIDSRVIIGSLARQLLQSIEFTPPENVLKYNFPLRDKQGVCDLLRDVIPLGQKVYCVIDGLYECDDMHMLDVFDALSLFQSTLKLHICLTFRLEATTKNTLKEAELEDLRVADIPDNSDDIENFIGDELERCIEHDLLKLGDPALVEEILTTLMNEAKGMFLWAELQISALCWTSSDKEIRRALRSLPKTLAETFERLLERAASHGLAGHDTQRKILSHMVAAARPLTKEEMGDLLGVTPFDLIWTPDQVCTNVDNMLATCGSLIAVDEETFAIHFIHSSAKKFLLERKGDDALNFDKSNTELAEVTVTYLNYNIFQTEIARVAKSSDGDLFQAPTKVIQSSIHSATVKSLSLRLLRFKRHKKYSSKEPITEKVSSKGPAINLDRIVNGNRDNKSVQDNANRISHPFYGYAVDFWAHHAATNTTFSGQYSKLLRKTIPIYLDRDKHAPEMKELITWANKESPDVLVIILDWFADMNIGNLTDSVQGWIAYKLNLERNYLQDLVARPKAAMHTSQQFVVNDHLEHLTAKAASCGQIDALDFFLYRAYRQGSLTDESLAKYVMVAIYKNQREAAQHLAWGNYRDLFNNVNPSAGATSLEPLSANQELLQRIGVWAAMFADEELFMTVTLWAKTPFHWTAAFKRRLFEFQKTKAFNDSFAFSVRVGYESGKLYIHADGNDDVDFLIESADAVSTMFFDKIGKEVLRSRDYKMNG